MCAGRRPAHIAPINSSKCFKKANGVLSFGTLIHSGDLKLPLPCLGQNSIGRVGQNSIGTNNRLARAKKPSKQPRLPFPTEIWRSAFELIFLNVI